MDDVINAVEAILVVAMAEQASIISAVAKLAADLVDGTIGAPEFVKAQYVSEVLADVKAILDVVGVENEVVNVVFEELINLYDGVTLEGIVEGTLAIAMDNVIASAEAVVKATKLFGSEHSHLICLNVSVIGDSNCAMSPLVRLFNCYVGGQKCIHRTHLCM